MEKTIIRGLKWFGLANEVKMGTSLLSRQTACSPMSGELLIILENKFYL